MSKKCTHAWMTVKGKCVWQYDTEGRISIMMRVKICGVWNIEKIPHDLSHRIKYQPVVPPNHSSSSLKVPSRYILYTYLILLGTW